VFPNNFNIFDYISKLLVRTSESQILFFQYNFVIQNYIKMGSIIFLILTRYDFNQQNVMINQKYVEILDLSKIYVFKLKIYF
jgi:hypothetical protein